ncbi:sensor histidine kinase [Arthrobacter sp. TWP1-1]|uniref:sensor histidine kinase n=1 Tax=Arthrobacter sp. TWP1-1 TaxID=2804568 RepID=UPI003CF5880E
MTDTPANQLIGRLFYQRSLRVRVTLSQLPFFLTVALAALLIGVLEPGLFGNSQLVVSLWLNGILTLACVVVPWDKLHPASYLVIPYLDFVAVALFRDGIQPLLSAAGMLALFPVFWICAAGMAPKTSVVSSTLASLLIVWNPVFQSGQVSADALIRPLLFPFMMLAFAITVVVLTTSMDGQRDSLLEKDKLLRAALAESQHRELLLETVVDTVGVGVVVVDDAGNDRLMNSTQVAIHALGRPHDIADPEEKELLLFSPDKVSLAPEDRPVRRAINGESFTNYQIWIGSGERARALSATARIMRTDDASSAGAVIAFHDVTDMVNALSAKDDFVANVSHEFRTPLTAIRGYLDLVLEAPEELPKDIRNYLGIASRNVDRLSSLVSDLLTTDSVTLELSRTEVSSLVAESLASATPMAERNKVTLISRVEAPMEAFIDSRRMGQVLDNLVSNAVKYSPDGGTVSVTVTAKGADLWCEVQDTGMGMDSGEQALAFSKFFRARTAVRSSIPGIGLGLMISKTIVAKHGGTISLLSKQGVGTTVSFVLPGCLSPAKGTPAIFSAGEPALDDAP